MLPKADAPLPGLGPQCSVFFASCPLAISLLTIFDGVDVEGIGVVFGETNPLQTGSLPLRI
jgi:hypothetical protein